MVFRLRPVLLVLIFSATVFSYSPVALAQTPLLHLPTATDQTGDAGAYPGVQVGEILKGNDANLTGAAGIVAFVKSIFGTLKQLLGPVLVVLIGYLGVQLIFARGQEETFSAITKNLLYVFVGIGLVIFADFLSETFSLYKEDASTFVSTATGAVDVVTAPVAVTEKLVLLIRFLRYVLGGIAVAYTVKSGLTIIFSADEETATKEKDIFIYGFLGFLLIIASEALVNVVFDVKTNNLGEVLLPQVNVTGGISLLTNVTNLFLAVLSSLFLFTLVVGGVIYALSAGNEVRGQKASKVIIGSLIGLVIAFSSYTIVSEFSSGGRELREVELKTIPLTAPLVPFN